MSVQVHVAPIIMVVKAPWSKSSIWSMRPVYVVWCLIGIMRLGMLYMARPVGS